MTDDELVSYCALHCTTPRALFRGDHVNRMLELAGHPRPFAQMVDPQGWFTVREEMLVLCDLAQRRTALSRRVLPLGLLARAAP